MDAGEQSVLVKLLFERNRKGEPMSQRRGWRGDPRVNLGLTLRAARLAQHPAAQPQSDAARHSPRLTPTRDPRTLNYLGRNENQNYKYINQMGLMQWTPGSKPYAKNSCSNERERQRDVRKGGGESAHSKLLEEKCIHIINRCIRRYNGRRGANRIHRAPVRAKEKGKGMGEKRFMYSDKLRLERFFFFFFFFNWVRLI